MSSQVGLEVVWRHLLKRALKLLFAGCEVMLALLLVGPWLSSRLSAALRSPGARRKCRAARADEGNQASRPLGYLAASRQATLKVAAPAVHQAM